MAKHMEIICVGNELLIGKTMNTNANWIARRATSLGIMVKRITVVGDDIDEIAKAIREATQRKPDFIITTGGLGPTFDDKTLEGIAKGIERKLETNANALRMVKEKYEAYHREGRIRKVELTPYRVKMATLPEGAEPMHNAVGTAPGVTLETECSCLVALPGVPPEMEAIFEESVAPRLKKAAEGMTYAETSLYARNIVESALAPLIDEAMHDCPDVYVKSHVYTEAANRSAGERGSYIELHLSTTQKDLKVAQRHLEKSAAMLSELIRKNGGKAERSTKKP